MIDRDKLLKESGELSKQISTLQKRLKLIREAIRCEDDKLAELFLHPEARIEAMYGQWTRLYEICNGGLYGLRIGDTVHVIDRDNDGHNILKLTMDADEYFYLMEQPITDSDVIEE